MTTKKPKKVPLEKRVENLEFFAEAQGGWNSAHCRELSNLDWFVRKLDKWTAIGLIALVVGIALLARRVGALEAAQV